MATELRMLDTSVVIRHFRQGGVVTKRLEGLKGLFLSTVALGELHTGAHRSARPAHNMERIEEFIQGVNIVPVDPETSRHYGLISSQLAAAGTPIPHNDMWIAACAVQWNLPLATTDLHYQRIVGLNLELW